jgi:hypothetical protein
LLAESEVWIGDDWVVETSRGRTLMVDFGESTLTYLDHTQEFWTSTPLPLDLDQLLVADARARMRANRTYGEVTRLDDTIEIEDVTCRKYRVDQWRERDGMRHDHATFDVWASEEPPHYGPVFAGFLEVMRQMYDRDATYRRELATIRGLQLRLEMREGTIWQRVRFVDSLDEIAAVPVPADLFTVPDHYRRVDRLPAVR